MNTRSVLDYQLAQGELRQVKVKLPAGQRLLRVEGDWIRVWELNEEAGGAVLTVDLLKGISPSYRLTLLAGVGSRATSSVEWMWRIPPFDSRRLRGGTLSRTRWRSGDMRGEVVCR